MTLRNLEHLECAQRGIPALDLDILFAIFRATKCARRAVVRPLCGTLDLSLDTLEQSDLEDQSSN